MPPTGALPADVVALIRAWIEDGAPSDANDKPKQTAKGESEMADAPVYIAADFADTPPMPEASLAAAHPLPERGVVARSVDVSPTAPLLAVGGDRQVLLYNLESFEMLGALPFPEGDIFTLSFSLNGEVLVVGGGQEGDMGRAAVFNVRTTERIGTYGQFYDTVLAADISPDHRMLALGGAGKTVRVYDMASGDVLYKMDKHTDWIYAIKFTPDGEVLSTADRAGNLQLWQAANGRHVEQLRGHEGAIHALDYTPDSLYLASAGEDGTVQVWDTWEFKRIRSFKAHSSPVLNLDISKDGNIVTASSDKTSKIFNLEGKEQKKFGGMPDWAYQARFAREASLVLAGTWTGEILCYNVESGEVVKKLGTDPTANQT
jgi:WD40 repeat protein